MTQAPAQNEEAIARLRLIRTPKIGPVTYSQLLLRYASGQAALEAMPELAKRGGGLAVVPADRADILREVDQVSGLGARYLFKGQGLYPGLLAQIDNAPPVLIVKGNLQIFDQPMVAMVGARNASAAAMRFGRQLAAELGEMGFAIVSGLARGIDTAVHAGSLSTGTIAVIAGGMDVHYPPENAQLQQDISEQGILVAEQPPGTEPRARHFPYRNRIIAGMAAGTVVVEAAPKSGSLITANYAGDYGREVMAVPGSPLDPRAQGCNFLIREGAILVQSAADIAETIRPMGEAFYAPPPPSYAAVPVTDEPDDHDRHAITSLLGPVAVPVDELIRQSEAPATLVQLVLLELELAGRLERHAGGRISLIA